MSSQSLFDQFKGFDRKKKIIVGFLAVVILFVFGVAILPSLSRATRSREAHRSYDLGPQRSLSVMPSAAPAPFAGEAESGGGLAAPGAFSGAAKDKAMRSDVAMEQKAAPGAPPQPPTAGYRNAAIPAAATGVDTTRKVIMTADIALEVKEFQPVADRITTIAESSLGYISQSTMSGGAGQHKSGTVTLRVPVKNFNRAIEEIGRLGKVISKNLQGQDVTEEYVDLQARARSKQRAEERMYAILTKARSIEETLRVEGQIEQIHTQIEQLLGKIKYLENRSDLSTISVAIAEAQDTANVVKPVPPGYWQTVWTDFSNGLKSSVRGALDTLVWFIGTVLGALIWFIIVGVPILLVWAILKRAWRTLRPAGAPPVPGPSQDIVPPVAE